MSEPMEPATEEAKFPPSRNTRKIVYAFLSPLVLVVFSIFATLPFLPFLLQQENPTDISIQVSVSITLLAEVLSILWFLWRLRLKPLKEALGLGLGHWWYVPLGLGGGVLLYLLLQAVATLIQKLSSSSVGSSDTSSSLTQLSGTGGYLFVLLVVGVLAPLVEEFYFRGVVVGALRESTWNKPWLMILVSGLAFGVLHFQGFSTLSDWFTILWITVLGFLFGWCRVKTNSLWLSTGLHIGYNVMTSVSIILIGSGAL